MDKYDALKLENQLCFPLYACAKEIVRSYQPLLKDLSLTYTQYIVMMVLWDEEETTVSGIGKRLYLDSGTLTPLLKKLEAKGYLVRQRSTDDERTLVIKITDEGKALKDRAVNVPVQLAKCVKLSPEEALTLHRILTKLMATLEPGREI